VAGTWYGLIGMLVLGVEIDAMLLAGAVTLLAVAASTRRGAWRRSAVSPAHGAPDLHR
jgi:hypothetical protein